jgi:hypothetical protein
MKRIFIGIIIFGAFIGSCLAGLGQCDIYFVKSASLTGASASDICVVNVRTGSGTGYYLIIADGSAMSDYMISMFTKWQNNPATVNYSFQTNTSIHYTGGSQGTPSGQYNLITTFGVLDNE